jgi:hypothetical protein|tara:strand:+ start:18444 stop:19166 length:723 start_codon:yes stop_codon:yes gene_type:complete
MALPQVNSSRYTMVIPSTGKQIEYRPFLVKEEKLLMVALESKDNKLIMRTLKDVISNCTFEEIDANNLANFDLEYMFLQLRSKSVGETAKIAINCKECDSPANHNVNLEDIKMDIPEKSNMVMLTDKIGLEMKYPSVAVMENLDIGNPEDLSAEEQLDYTSSLILLCIDSIFDEEDVHSTDNYKESELVEFVDGLNSAQFKKVTDFFNDMPALTHNLKWDCKECGHSNDIELRGLQSFFT